MEQIINWESQFENSQIDFDLFCSPVSLQNKSGVKEKFKLQVQDITKKCPFIITSVCRITITYYCENIKRLHNLSSYDMDNIVKPILDAISGNDGVIVDDYLFDGVEVNWIDKMGNDEINIHIEYPELLFTEKEDLIFLKKGQWCFTTSKKCRLVEKHDALISDYLDIWNSIQSENQYYKNVGMLPYQRFVPYNKIANKGFNIKDIK